MQGNGPRFPHDEAAIFNQQLSPPSYMKAAHLWQVCLITVPEKRVGSRKVQSGLWLRALVSPRPVLLPSTLFLKHPETLCCSCTFYSGFQKSLLFFSFLDRGLQTGLTGGGKQISGALCVSRPILWLVLPSRVRVCEGFTASRTSHVLKILPIVFSTVFAPLGKVSDSVAQM